MRAFLLAAALTLGLATQASAAIDNSYAIKAALEEANDYVIEANDAADSGDDEAYCDAVKSAYDKTWEAIILANDEHESLTAEGATSAASDLADVISEMLDAAHSLEDKHNNDC